MGHAKACTMLHFLSLLDPVVTKIAPLQQRRSSPFNPGPSRHVLMASLAPVRNPFVGFTLLEHRPNLEFGS